MDIHDPDEVLAIAAHLELLTYTRPRPGLALKSACEATGLPPLQITIWIGDVRGQLGRFIWDSLVHDEVMLDNFVTIAAKANLPPCMTVATPTSEAFDVMGELLPDLLLPAMSRPTGTVVVIIADKDDDTRLAFFEPDKLMMEQ